MTGSRGLVIALLIMSAACLSIVPNVNSQNASTTIITRTLTNTVTSYSSSIYGATTILTTGTISDYINGRRGTCYLGWHFFNSTGTTIHIAYSAGQPMTLYILNFMQWGSWIYSTDPCSPKSVVYQSTASSGTFDVDLPTSGNSYALVIVASALSNPSITVTLGPVLLLSRTTVTTSIPIVSIITGTTTLTSLMTFETPFHQPFGVWIAVTLLAVALVGYIAYRKVHAPKIKRSRRSKGHRPKGRIRSAGKARHA